MTAVSAAIAVFLHGVPPRPGGASHIRIHPRRRAAGPCSERLARPARRPRRRATFARPPAPRRHRASNPLSRRNGRSTAPPSHRAPDPMRAATSPSPLPASFAAAPPDFPARESRQRPPCHRNARRVIVTPAASHQCRPNQGNARRITVIPAASRQRPPHHRDAREIVPTPTASRQPRPNRANSRRVTRASAASHQPAPRQRNARGMTPAPAASHPRAPRHVILRLFAGDIPAQPARLARIADFTRPQPRQPLPPGALR